MFDSIRRGFGFLGQALDLARKDRDLLKPSLISLVVSALVSVVGALPLIVVAVLGAGSDLTQYVLYVLGALLIFALLVNLHLILALAVAVPVAGLLIALITAFTSDVTTAYHTSLFLWAREAERAVGRGQSVRAAAVPAPLAAVLARA
jgi:hypothetical protein